MHCKNYPCKIESGCVCLCTSCAKQDTFDIKQEMTDLKRMMEALNKNYETHCPHCGKSYVEPAPIYPMPFPYTGTPYPYIPGTPIGPYWTWPNVITISGGTVSNDLDKAVNINVLPPNWINGDGGSTI